MTDSSERGYPIQESPDKPAVHPDQPPKTSGLATASCLLGFLSLVISLLAGIPALLLGFLALGQISKSEGRLKGKPLAIAGMIMAILLSVVNYTAFWLYRERARDIVAINNTRQIAIGMLNYESAQMELPPDISVPETGEALLSWRVAILPFIEQQELYRRFHRDEHWDSPHNLEVAKDMPSLFDRAGVGLEKGMTLYQRPVGNGALFQPTVKGQRPRKVSPRMVSDKPSQTVMIVETTATEAVPWTKPADYRYDSEDPARGLGAGWSGKLIFAMVDGSGTFVTKDKAEKKTLQQVFTSRGGDIPVLTEWKNPQKAK